MRRARAAGADAAEVYLWAGRYHHAKLGGSLRNVQRTDASGLSVRVLVDGRPSLAVTSGLAGADLDWAVARAVRSARLVPRASSSAGFARPVPVPGAPTPVDERLVHPEADRLLAAVAALGEAVEGSPAVDYAEATVASNHGLFCVANSEGVAAWDRNAYETVVFEVRARGDVAKFAKTGAFGRRPVHECEDLDALARGIVDLADAATRPERLDAPVERVIFDAVAAKEILHRILPSFNGQAVHEGRSRLKDKLGEPVADESLTIRDRPADGLGCRNQRVDDEGTPTRDNTLLDRGRVGGFLYDWRAAAEARAAPTGSGFRPIDNRHTDPPGPATVNVEVAPGDRSLEEMVEEADRAVLIRGGVLGSFTMNPFLGNFSFVVPMAHYVEGGKVRHAVASGTAGGNLFDCIRRIRGLGREPRRLVAGTSVALSVDGVTFVT